MNLPIFIECTDRSDHLPLAINISDIVAFYEISSKDEKSGQYKDDGYAQIKVRSAAKEYLWDLVEDYATVKAKIKKAVEQTY